MKTLSTIFLLTAAFILFQSASCNKVKELDYIGIQQTKIESINLNNAAIKINLEYYNPNNFSVDVKETNLSIYLNGKFIATADQPMKTVIPKSSKFIFPVVAHFNPFKALSTAFSSLFSKTSKLSIQGTARLGKKGVYIKIPVSITEDVSLLSN